MNFEELFARVIQRIVPRTSLKDAMTRALLIKVLLRKCLDYPNLRMSHFIHDAIVLYYRGSKPAQLSHYLYLSTELDLLKALERRLFMLDEASKGRIPTRARVEKTKLEEEL